MKRISRRISSKQMAGVLSTSFSSARRIQSFFLGEDPAAPHQGGKPRTLSIEEAFKVHLGKTFVDWRFTSNEAAVLSASLFAWLDSKGLVDRTGEGPVNPGIEIKAVIREAFPGGQKPDPPAFYIRASMGGRFETVTPETEGDIHEALFTAELDLRFVIDSFRSRLQNEFKRAEEEK